MDRRITVGGKSYIAWDDVWHCIEVNGVVFYLTSTQYRICRAFLVASETRCSLGAGKFVILAYQSCDHLLGEMSLTRASLLRHMSDLNARITPLGLELCSFQGGYILSFSASMVQKISQ